MSTVAQNHLQQLIAKKRAEQAALAQREAQREQEREQSAVGGPHPEISERTIESTSANTIESTQAPAQVQPAPTAADSIVHNVPTASAAIVWNTEQLSAIEFAKQRKEFCLIGAAGTGKTTTTKEIIRECMHTVPKMRSGTKHLRAGLPAICLVSFTNRAVRNIAKALADIPELLPHCMTIHKLIEFQPVYREVYSELAGKYVNKMSFEPARNQLNPIPDIQLCIVDESSMVDVNLHQQLADALPNARFIYLGDLNQLPPVFGDGILGFKLAELPVIELTKVYRQAMQSPIVAFQHNFVLKGFPPSEDDLAKITAEGTGLFFHKLKRNLIDGKREKADKEEANGQMCMVFGKHFEGLYDAGKYAPGEDVILIPFNKAFGTIELNKHIAQFLGTKAEQPVHEVIAGMETHYFAVGDYIVFNKQEWYIKAIESNPQYFGNKTPAPASINLDRWGVLHGARSLMQEISAAAGAAGKLERLLDTVAVGNDAEDIENAASHEITLVNAFDDSVTCEVNTRGEINALSFGYAITIHKSQGSEWRRVFLFMNKQHSVMHSREILYTGMTRAREELHVFFDGSKVIGKKDNCIAKCIKNQSIPGKTWQEKRKYFTAKWDQYQAKKNGNVFDGTDLDLEMDEDISTEFERHLSLDELNAKNKTPWKDTF